MTSGATDICRMDAVHSRAAFGSESSRRLKSWMPFWPAWSGSTLS